MLKDKVIILKKIAKDEIKAMDIIESINLLKEGQILKELTEKYYFGDDQILKLLESIYDIEYPFIPSSFTFSFDPEDGYEKYILEYDGCDLRLYELVKHDYTQIYTKHLIQIYSIIFSNHLKIKLHFYNAKSEELKKGNNIYNIISGFGFDMRVAMTSLYIYKSSCVKKDYQICLDRVYIGDMFKGTYTKERASYNLMFDDYKDKDSTISIILENCNNYREVMKFKLASDEED